jgi:hypothetical protein
MCRMRTATRDVPRQSRLSCPRKRASSNRRAAIRAGAALLGTGWRLLDRPPARTMTAGELGNVQVGVGARRREACGPIGRRRILRDASHRSLACAGCVNVPALRGPQDDGGGIIGGAARSLARAFLLRALHGLVGGLLRHAEMLADLPPVGAGLEGLLHGPLLRHAR